MVKCPRCGYENPASSTYCDNCAYLLTNQNVNGTDNNQKTKRWSIGIAKKIVIVLGIVVIALLLFSFIYNNSQPSSQESLNVITDDGSSHSSSYPYVAVIKYDGNWYARMGDPNYLSSQIGYGEKKFTLDCASWERVSVIAQKDDYGEGNLTIQLLRNGKVVAENSTTDSSGSIVIHYNY